MDSLTLTVSPRTVTGKKVKALRREGVVPVHMFGRGIESQSLQAEFRVLSVVLPQAGTNVPIAIDVDGADGENVCFVRQVQRHPVSEALLHVDFQRVDVSQKVTAEVPILVEGVSQAVQEMDGTLLQTLASVSVEALPMSMPASFTIDISILDDFDKTIRVETLQTDEDVTILNDPEEMIATIVRPRVEEEEVPVEEELEGLEGVEGEEVEEGEEGAEAAGEEEES
jgi:large subunit ribosomal protein L25